MKINNFIEKISSDSFNKIFNELYGNSQEIYNQQKTRYIDALTSFSAIFPKKTDINVYSAPGRTEIGGNHTDHQHGAILAGAVNLDTIAVVSFHDEGVIRVHSKGYAPFEIDMGNLSPEKCDSGTALIIKGVLSKYKELGVVASGFDMYCTSDVLSGGGISSSASFEILICTIINEHYNNGKSSSFEMAQIGHFAENKFFGKKCGLLDQTVASFGGLVSIDFGDPKKPIVEKINFDFDKYEYTLCITDTKSNHENLTDEYDAIGDEMRNVASYFDCKVLNEVNVDSFYENIPELRKLYGDRAVLRSMHYFNETKRAKDEAEVLKNGDINRFIQLVNESGESSANLLQNLYSCRTPSNQEIPLALALSKKVLKNEGAARVHGGGFAGTIQAFVPNHLLDEYIAAMEKIFGEGACMKLRIRPYGGVEIK